MTDSESNHSFFSSISIGGISARNAETAQLASTSLSNQSWRWWLTLLLIGAFALGFRIYYVTHAVVFQPANLPKAHGDAVEYYNYARNLVQYGTFSRDPLGALQPVADTFRDPGYPMFLAAWMKVFPQWDSWYTAVLFSQALLGALTVLLWLQLGRRFLSLRWLLAAGVIMAIWPHSVAMSSNIMSETLYGFLVPLALLVFGIAIRRGCPIWAVASALCFSMAALTNSVLLPFPVLITLYALFRHQMRIGTAVVLIVSMLVILSPWSIHKASLQSDRQSSSDRALMNLVQGSWPIYHSAVRASQILGDPRATAVINQVNVEIYTIEDNHLAGLSTIYRRMAQHPGRYLFWYLQKPMLLWDWSIRTGAGDIYFHATYHSPFDVNPIWKATAALCHACNRLLMLLALAGCALALSRRIFVGNLQVASLLLLFITIIHSLLQAEPRYSIPYRGGEIMLGLFALSWLTQKVWQLRNHTT